MAKKTDNNLLVPLALVGKLYDHMISVVKPAPKKKQGATREAARPPRKIAEQSQNIFNGIFFLKTGKCTQTHLHTNFFSVRDHDKPHTD